MKLNRSREAWRTTLPYSWANAEAPRQALEDLATLHAEVERLREALKDIIDDCEAEYPPSYGAIRGVCKMALGDTHD